MVIIMMDNLKMIKYKVKGFSKFLINLNTMDFGKIINLLEKVKFHGRMGLFIKVILKME